MRRILGCRKPVVWLRALPGTGKTRVLREIGRGGSAIDLAEWLILDDPDAETLQAALRATQVHSGRALRAESRRRLLIASRANAAIADVMLTASLYGHLEVLGDSDLFFTAADCRVAGSAELLAVSGGWPLLMDGWVHGRALEMSQMLPAFLDREVLPDAPPRVVTALFGALAAPLGPSAVAYLFGTGQPLHPLLRTGADGVSVAGTWVRDALLKLRTRPRALDRAVLEELVVLHTRFADPTRAIIALVDLGLFAQAVEVFNAAGGMFFGYRHGYQSLEAVLERFGAEWERRTDSLFFARLYLLTKSGRPREALMRLEAQYPGLPVDLRRLRLSHRPYAVLMRLDMSLDIDETPVVEVILSWGRLESFLAPGDDLARGILYNTMAIGLLQAQALLQARELAEEALALYRRAGSPYLAHFMSLHLCDVALRRGRLSEAVEQLSLAAEALDASGLVFNSEPAIIECFKARIAYEEGRFADCPQDIDPILQALLRGDSWVDLIAAVASQCVFAAFWQQGLRPALDLLDRCALTLSRRHGATRNRHLDLIRIRLFQAARRHEEAGARLEEFDLAAPLRRTASPDAEEGLIRLRQQIVRKSSATAALRAAAQIPNLPGFDARQMIALSILQGYLRHRQRETGPARRHLAVSLRTAETENLLAVLVEHGQFLEPLLPLMTARGPGNARLAAFAERIARLLRTLPSAPAYSKALAGVTRQEHRVLAYVADGYTNKQAARALGLSESAVKFHLRNLFRKLHVSTRAALGDAAARRGMRT